MEGERVHLVCNFVCILFAEGGNHIKQQYL
jgi:hypothetical protein